VFHEFVLFHVCGFVVWFPTVEFLPELMAFALFVMSSICASDNVHHQFPKSSKAVVPLLLDHCGNFGYA
jgi:hypothetical protein